ncbi:MAG: TlpA family protein disulfide reductase [Acidimicrobiales bacterium]
MSSPESAEVDPVPADSAPSSATPPAPHGRPGGGARRPRPVFLLVGVVIAAALGVGLFTGIGTPSSSHRAATGALVPSFSLDRLGGGAKVGVPADGGGNGKPAILLFFASWCEPCQHEVPALAQTYRRQQQSGSPLAKVALIGIDDLDPTGSALSFVHKSGVTFPTGADGSGNVTNGIFQFTGLPGAVFVDGDGTIARITFGALTPAKMVAWQRTLLKTA